MSGLSNQFDGSSGSGGDASAANQTTMITHLSEIEGATESVEAGYAAEGAALGSGVLLQGDDGTDRKNVNVDPTTGDVQVDVTNTVTVDGSGVTQPVSGTVTAELSAVDNAVLDTIDAVLDTIKTDTAAIVTAVQLIDNIVSSINGPGAPTIDSYTSVAINLTTGANQVLASSAVDKQIWVYGYGFTCGDAAGQTVSLQDEDDAAVTGIMEFGQYGGISVPPSGNFAMPVHKLATNKDLEVDITGGDVDGWIAYAIVSV